MTRNIDAKATAQLTGTAGSILAEKGSTVHSIAPGESVFHAVERMSELQVGALFVMEGGKLLGVISERDYARKVILQGRASKETPVSEIMTSPVISVEPSTPLAECMRLVNDRRIRHLPVIDAGRLVGVVSIGDLVHAIVLQQAALIEQLNAVISGPYPA